METTHRLLVGDARSMVDVEADSVELVVTSPPYPMIEMWDDQFELLDAAIGQHLESGEGAAAFAAMHAQLDRVWDHIARVLIDGGIACINVGDATRTVDDTFRVYQNHARIIQAFEDRGFHPLPEILWRKPSNSAAKFMGSGMLPPNAYVTLEHEYVLVFRNGAASRSFDPGEQRRYEAAYFWEERNRWFSDVWTDIRGERQPLESEAIRERSAAYPLAIPYRLINMYSVYGDTVLDPFLGTGTTTIAALIAGRNSVGVELDPEVAAVLGDRIAEVPALSKAMATERLAAHRAFVQERQEAGESLSHESHHYGFPVRTQQEEDLRLYAVADIEGTERGYVARHEPVADPDGPGR